MKKTVVSGQVSLANNTDVHVSRQAPPFPIVGQMWLDITTEPPILKKYDGQTWVKTTMDIEQLDPIKYNRILSGIAIAQESADGKTTNYYGYIAPTKAKNGDMWFQYNEAGTVCTGLFVWNNGAWIKKELDAQALSVDKLSALSADLGNVTAGNITGVKITGSEFTTALSDGVTNTTIKDGGVMAGGNIERYFQNDVNDTPALRRYPATAELTSGFLRFSTTDKLYKPAGSDWTSVLANPTLRRLYFTEKGIATQYDALSSYYSTNSRFIDFFANEVKGLPGNTGNEGYTGSGMRIYSGQQLEIEGKKQLTAASDQIRLTTNYGASNPQLTLFSDDFMQLYAAGAINLNGGRMRGVAEISSGITIGDSQGTLSIKNSSTYLDQVVVQCQSLYDRTTSSPANMVVSTSGILSRATSARKYKLNIADISDIQTKAKKVLAITPKKWNDRSQVEELANALNTQTLEELDPAVKLDTFYGFIADDFHDADLTEVVQYNEQGEVDALSYDRISIYHNVVLKEHEDKLTQQAAEIEALKQQVATLTELVEGMAKG